MLKKILILKKNNNNNQSNYLTRSKYASPSYSIDHAGLSVDGDFPGHPFLDSLHGDVELQRVADHYTGHEHQLDRLVEAEENHFYQEQIFGPL